MTGFVKNVSCINDLICPQTMDFQRIYNNMVKPAFIFDGRLILDHEKLMEIGFKVETIGKRLQRDSVTRTYANGTS